LSPYLLLALLVIGLLSAGSYVQQRRQRLALRTQLRAQWGRPNAVDRDPALIASYHEALAEPSIDDRTWRDLDLDAVFGFLDRTESVVGRQFSTIEYVNLLFCLDVNAAMIGVRELRRHQMDVHRIFQAVGEIESALSIASVRDGFRASVGRDGWTRPQFGEDDQPAVLEDARHPLIENAVPNSATLGPPAGLLVTGANMTGKSTFLRTVGVNVVLAQTMNSVFASAYSAPWLSVASCITPSDDLQAGKSYYQAEVETLVAMLGRRGSRGTRLYLFDELFAAPTRSIASGPRARCWRT
jgi:hypothetical protein